MNLDIPYWIWVLARRVPLFALVTTLIAVIGATVISRHTQSYYSTSVLLINPSALQHRNGDSQTQFELLKFHVLTSGEAETAANDLELKNDPINRININHDESTGKVYVGFYDYNATAALTMARTITRIFQSTANQLQQRDAIRRAEFHENEVAALYIELTRKRPVAQAGSLKRTDADLQLKEELYQAALTNFVTAKADIQGAQPSVMTLLKEPMLAKSASGPNKKSMYLAVLSFAIFCGLIMVLVLEWVETIIRRPTDIENTLGFATFGVIPDLQVQPITAASTSKRGI